MNLYRAIAILIVSLPLILCGQTLYGDLVLPAGAFLWLPVDAATDAMGGAATADGGRTGAGWANPATAFGDETYSAGATYNYLREKTGHSGLFAAGRWKKWASAARLFIMNSGDIEARTGPTSEPDYTFTSHQLYLQMTGARRIANFLTLGTSAKYIHERIDQDDRDGWVFDFGITGEYDFLKAGVSVQNWGDEIVFLMFRERYPLTYRIGAAGEVLDYGTIRLDWIKPDRLGGWAALGAEGNLGKYFLLRAGYTFGHDTRNISAGFGAKFRGLALDYSLANHSEGLGMSHQVTLSFAPSSR